MLLHQAAFKLAGKVAVITGAASGIGKATASEFIRNGAKVIIADVQQELGNATAAELGPDATFIKCDVLDESQVAAAVDLAVSMHGHLDVMFNNAGTTGSLATAIASLDLASFDRTMAVNVRSVMAGMKHAARVMIPRRAGCILCTSSTSAILGGLTPHDYATSKSAVLGVAKSAAAELARHGIRVNCVTPHVVPTPMVYDGLRRMMPGLDDEKLKEMMRSTGELSGAVLEAADVAKAVVFLASDDAKYISGHNLLVDGGFTGMKRLETSPPEK